MRTSHTFTIDPPVFKRQVLQWAQQFSQIAWLDSNGHHEKYGTYDAVMAVEAVSQLKTSSHRAFDKLDHFLDTTSDWVFGYLSYDLKNDIEDLSSGGTDGLHFPELHFFQPKRLFLVKGKEVHVLYHGSTLAEVERDFEAIRHINCEVSSVTPVSLELKPRLSIADYRQKVETLLAHINRGDVYEANFCQEFYASSSQIEPLLVYNRFNHISQAPFTAFYRLDSHYILSASPERYLKRTGNEVVSQPIKGTAKRSIDPQTDESLKQQLRQSPKERAENIMVVDLVRNDLSHTALPGSVKVEELCSVYSFKQVHQMISTIRSQVAEKTKSVDIIKSTFPMGSMTGAPKISAMNIIEHLEVSKRGVYSGAIGYFDPQQDFDFNVVIRSIVYNADEGYISCSVGSAITAQSDPGQEYEECLLKAKAMREILEH